MISRPYWCMVMPMKLNAIVVMILMRALVLLAFGVSSGCVAIASFCPDCNGDANRTMCSTCWGEGLRVEEHKVSFDQCATCLGTGQNQTMYRPVVSEVLAQYTLVCPSCSGRGQKRMVTPIRVFCKRCNGSGRGITRVICARCNGSGRWKGIFRSGKNQKGWIAAPSQFILPEIP